MKSPHSNSSALHLRKAVESDVPRIIQFIREIAAFEDLADQVQATENSLQQALFSEHPSAEALLAEIDGKPAGFAVYFMNFSTFTGKPGLYLEDIYLNPEQRGRGYGRAILTELARIAYQRECPRLDLAALNWNENATRLYRKLGAEPLSEWTLFRFDETAIRKLAEKDGLDLLSEEKVGQ